MQLHEFLHALQDSSRVRVDDDVRRDLFTGSEAVAAEAALRELNHVARLELPGPAPRFSPLAALWALATLYRAAQCYTYRELDEKTVRRLFASRCPVPLGAETVYSVDLTLYWLPDLLQLSRGLARDDPLVEELLRLARDWPLSSVGVREVGEIRSDRLRPVLDDITLRRLYVDRILERRDTSRLSDPLVRESVREVVGLHEDLAPEAARALVEGRDRESETDVSKSTGPVRLTEGDHLCFPEESS